MKWFYIHKLGFLLFLFYDLFVFKAQQINKSLNETLFKAPIKYFFLFTHIPGLINSQMLFAHFFCSFNFKVINYKHELFQIKLFIT